MKSLSVRVVGLVLAATFVAAAQTQAPPDRFFDSNCVQIRYVEQGDGGEQGVLRRPETMAALRELWSGARSR